MPGARRCIAPGLTTKNAKVNQVAGQDLLAAMCLVLVLEGILPFLMPARWRTMVLELAQLSESSIRLVGFGSMVLGAGLLYLVK